YHGDARGAEHGGAGLGAEEGAHAVARPGGLGGERARLQRALELLVGDVDAVDLVLTQESQEAAHGDLDRLGRDEPALDDGQDHGGDEDVDKRKLRLLTDRSFHFLYPAAHLRLMLSEPPEAVKPRPPASIDGAVELAFAGKGAVDRAGWLRR